MKCSLLPKDSRGASYVRSENELNILGTGNVFVYLQQEIAPKSFFEVVHKIVLAQPI